MERLMGAVLLLLGGAWAGQAAAGERARRARDLERWEEAVGGMIRELDFRLPSTPDLLEGAAGRSPSPVREVLLKAAAGMDRLGEQEFHTIWDRALAGCPGALSREDLALLSRLGGLLGRYGAEDQHRGLEGVRAALEERRREARSGLESRGRVCRALGLALGGFLAILLL